MSGDSYTALNPGAGGANIYGELLNGSTTIAAGSNGGILPQSTINVASTTATSFGTAGIVLIGTIGAIVAYTGTTATTLTGCTLVSGSGTLVTSQTVTSLVTMQAGKVHLGGVGIDLGPVTNANPFPVRAGIPSKYSYTACPVNGQSVFSGVGSALFVFDLNTTGGSEFLHFFDATATQANNAVPMQTTASIASAASTATTLGHTFYGVEVITGLWMQPSTTQSVMTKLASSTNNSGFILYWPG